MKELPQRPHGGHLRKQAKQLIADCRSKSPKAYDRFRSALSAAAGKSGAEIAAMELRLSDAQSCLAREYGFQSWKALIESAELQALQAQTQPERRMAWLRLVYAGDLVGGLGGSRPELAARALREAPSLTGGDWLGCARALTEHGMPGVLPDPGHPESVLFQGQRSQFSEEVADHLLSLPPR